MKPNEPTSDPFLAALLGDPNNPLIAALIRLFNKQARRAEVPDPDRLSDNFKLSEFLNQMPPEFRTPTEEHKKNLFELVTYVLEPLRLLLKCKIEITSGFRTREYTLDLRRRGYKAAIGGDHERGQAADIVCYRNSDGSIIPPLDVYMTVKKFIPLYRQNIWYQAKTKGYPNGGNHVSYDRNDNKKENLKMIPWETYLPGP